MKELPKDLLGLAALWPPSLIADEAEYDMVQELIDRLTSIPELTEGQEKYLDMVVPFFSAYERKHYPI